MRRTKIIKKTMMLCLSLTALVLVGCIGARLTSEDIYDLQKTANAGHVRSQVTIGEIYEYGVNVPLDHLIAAQWYQLAAKQGDPEAQFYLGVIYERGVGLKRNPAEALKWLFKSAEQGHERARILLAILYLKDKEIRPAFSKQIKGYRLQAEKGDANAQYIMGFLQLEGAGLPVNAQEALKWYRKSAEQGNSKARLALGDIYLNAADPREALSWYRKSAETDLRAQVKLYHLYQGKDGIPEDAEAARRYLQKISRQTDASLHSYLEAQHTFLNLEKTKNPTLALRACRRISELDPDAGKVSALCHELKKEAGDKMKSRVQEAQAALEQKDWSRFDNLFNRLLTPDFDESQFRKLIKTGWRLSEEEKRATEKIVQDQLRALETALRSASPRAGNIQSIHKLINTFRESIARGLHDYPDDAALAELARKGNKIIATLRQKIKAPPPPEEKAAVESPDEMEEEPEPGEEDYDKARELLNAGRFEEAETLLEKTTKTRGSRFIAPAYIYLGISHLARINPANVNDARKRHLKGMACFQNALRFDAGIALPSGYDKYQPVFEQAKEQLNSRR